MSPRPLIPLLALVCMTAHAQVASTKVNLVGVPDGPVSLAGVKPLEGDWQVQGGAFAVASLGSNWLHLGSNSPFGAQRVEATVVAEKPLRQKAWSAAGVAVHFDNSNFWRLTVVESALDPAIHYAELLECHQGLWQAQTEPGTRLRELTSASSRFDDWQYGKTYRYVIELTRDRISGRIYDGAALKFERVLALEPTIPAVAMGWPALLAVEMQARFSDISYSAEAFGARKPALPAGAVSTVTLLDEPRPGLDPKLVPALEAQLKQAGLSVRRMTARQLAKPGALSIADTDLIAIPHCQSFPLPLREPLLRYLRDGGNLLALGGPMFQTWLMDYDGEWFTTDEVMGNIRPDYHLFTFTDPEPMKGWVRASNDPKQRETLTSEAAPAGAEGKAVRVDVRDLNNWDTLQCPPGSSFFKPGHDLTVLWAKGDAQTPYLILEWKEKDESRWIATIKLTTEWKRYGLTPADFKFYGDSKAQGRGGTTDRLNPQNTVIFSIGMAQSHSAISNGPRTYWIADVGTAKAPFELPSVEPPLLEGLSPWYKSYKTPVCAGVMARGDQALVTGFSGARIASAFPSPYVRLRGTSLSGGRQTRMIPLLDAVAADGATRGCAAATYVSLAPPYIHATWTTVPLGDQDLLGNMSTLGPALAQVCRRITDGVFLVEAGTSKFSYWPGEKATVGAEVVNLGRSTVECSVALSPLGKGGAPLQTWTHPLTLHPGERQEVRDAWNCAEAHSGVVSVLTQLSVGGATVDKIAQVVRLLDTPRPDKGQQITAHDGDFYKGGKLWNPVGVNYWAHYVSGLEPGVYHLGWLTPGIYDPLAVERDLALMESLGMNWVSISGGTVGESAQLTDFLQRCGSHGVKVNMFLGGADPRDFNENQVRQVVETGKLAQSDALASYDLCWEPHWGDHTDRTHYDGDWAAWIDEQYGSTAAAEKLWGFACPRAADGTLTNPSDDQLVNDGEWGVMVAAYRRFVDDWLSRRFNVVRTAIHKYDPNHLISFRVGYGGTGQVWPARMLAYDPLSGAKHLDFVSPEGYGTDGAWENYVKAGVITAYCRWAGANAPVYWAEFGYSVYPGTATDDLEIQGKLWDGMCRMNTLTGANGLAGWWWPGGYRVDEKSDYGITEPWGAPRPAALAMQKHAAEIAVPRPRAKVKHTIIFDRDQHTIGLNAIWTKNAAEYAANIKDNAGVALATAGDGRTSGNCPLTAVGGAPYSGVGPLQYLNGEFNRIEVRVNGGAWQAVPAEGVVNAPRGATVELRASLGNTGISAWAAGGEGAVSLAVRGAGIEATAPLKAEVKRYRDGDFGPVVVTRNLDGEIGLTLRLRLNRGAGGYFGEARQVRVIGG